LAREEAVIPNRLLDEVDVKNSFQKSAMEETSITNSSLNVNSSFSKSAVEEAFVPSHTLNFNTSLHSNLAMNNAVVPKLPLSSETSFCSQSRMVETAVPDRLFDLHICKSGVEGVLIPNRSLKDNNFLHDDNLTMEGAFVPSRSFNINNSILEKVIREERDFRKYFSILDVDAKEDLSVKQIQDHGDDGTNDFIKSEMDLDMELQDILFSAHIRGSQAGVRTEVSKMIDVSENLKPFKDKKTNYDKQIFTAPLCPFNAAAFRASVKIKLDEYTSRLHGDKPTMKDVHFQQILAKLDSLARNRKLNNLEDVNKIMEEGDAWEARLHTLSGKWLDYPRTLKNAERQGLKRRQILRWKIIVAERETQGLNQGMKVDIGAEDSHPKSRTGRRRIGPYTGPEIVGVPYRSDYSINE
jgi:hypothetical protein